MDLLNKILFLLLVGFLSFEIFPQEQSYIPANGNINNSFLTKNIYNISTFTQLKKNITAGVLDSLICVFTDGDTARVAYNYNDDLSLNYLTYAILYKGEWINLEKHTNTYDYYGNLISVLWEDAISKEWLIKDVYNYDSLGNQVSFLHQYWNGQIFENDFRYDNYYLCNNLVSSIFMKWIDSNWVNYSKSFKTYNSENLCDTALTQEYVNGSWVNDYLYIFVYENDNLIINRVKRWQENQWSDIFLETLDYDDNDNCIIEDFQILENSSWRNWFRIFYEYDDKNNLIHLFGEECENGEWIPKDEPLKVTNPDGILYGYLAKEIFLFYRNPTSVRSEKNIADGFNLLQNYPNPFNPNTVISYNIPERSIVTLNIYNLLGEKIKTLVNKEQMPGKYEINFDGNNLPSGIYFYQLKTEKFQQTKKMLLLR